MTKTWLCQVCLTETDRTHWRHGADGAMFHVGPDAPPSDPGTPPAGYGCTIGDDGERYERP